MKIAFFELEKWEEKFIAERLKGHELSFVPGELNEKSAGKAKGAEAAGVFIYSKIDAKVLEKLPKLKLVTTMSTGFDHIDVKECAKHGVTICNVPSYGENTVAEHTFALLLALSRKIHLSYERTQRADFSAVGLRGFDLKGKTLGVIGCGHIGKHVVRIARGFEMNVLVFERHPDKKLAKKLGFKIAPLEKIYAESDIISFHVPLNESTKHMLNGGTLAKLKKGCIVLNTSRGEIIDTEALIKGLSQGIVGGAGLDVLEGECFIREEKQVLHKNFPKECDLKMVLENHVLLKEPNVLITPHNAFNSREALERILTTTIESIESFVKGKKINEVKAAGK